MNKAVEASGEFQNHHGEYLDIPHHDFQGPSKNHHLRHTQTTPPKIQQTSRDRSTKMFLETPIHLSIP